MSERIEPQASGLITASDESIPFDKVGRDRRKKANRSIYLLTQFPGITVEENPNVLPRTDGRTFIEAEVGGKKLLFLEARKFSEEFPCRPDVIVSGICMFSAWGLVGVGDDGKIYTLLDPKTPPSCERIGDILYLPRLSLYEEESLYLLSLLSNAVLQNLRESNPRLFFHGPVEEYFLYFYKLHLEGKLEKDKLKKVYELLKWRGQILFKEFQRNVEYKYIQRAAPLFSIPEVLLQEGISLEEAMKNVVKNSDYREEWEKIIEKSPDLNIPNLTYLSYVATYLRALRETLSGGVLAVEKAEELRIALQTKKLCDELSVKFGGIYVHDTQFPPDYDGTGRNYLFFYRPPDLEYNLVNL